MKISEMNNNQKRVYHMVVDACNEFIGGWENTMLDEEEGSEEWQKAKKMLEAGHDTLVEWILSDIRSSAEWICYEHLHFVSLEWTKERIDRRLKKMGY